MTASWKPRLWITLGIVVMLALGGWWWRTSHTAALPEKQEAAESNPNFPINDKLELPFIGKVRCHSRHEEVSFEANGKPMKWPFKMYYLPNGMFVRAEFVKLRTKDYEMAPKEIEMSYRTRGLSLVGFPKQPAPANLGKVLQSLYENEPFDRATKINITWVLQEGTDGEVKPLFIANIFGVSAGLMRDLKRVPDDDERFWKYRIELTPEGEAVLTSNML